MTELKEHCLIPKLTKTNDCLTSPPSINNIYILTYEHACLDNIRIFYDEIIAINELYKIKNTFRHVCNDTYCLKMYEQDPNTKEMIFNGKIISLGANMFYTKNDKDDKDDKKIFIL